MPPSLALQKGERVLLTVPVYQGWTSSWIHATDGRVVLLFGSRMGYGGGGGAAAMGTAARSLQTQYHHLLYR